MNTTSSNSARKLWEERVSFVASQVNDLEEERNKLIMWNAPNGDLYLSICPESHNGGIHMRIERSGGAATRNPKLVKALTDAYDAIAGNYEETP